MTISITDDEWDELVPENFDTSALLRAVDAVDVLRDDLNDSEDGGPLQLRTDLLKLHQLAMAVFNEGSRWIHKAKARAPGTGCVRACGWDSRGLLDYISAWEFTWLWPRCSSVIRART